MSGLEHQQITCILRTDRCNFFTFDLTPSTEKNCALKTVKKKNGKKNGKLTLKDIAVTKQEIVSGRKGCSAFLEPGAYENPTYENSNDLFI